MSHFAEVVDGKITRVIVADQGFIDEFMSSEDSHWVQTSYNTYGNEHLLGGTPLRCNYASLGGSYDVINDVFYAPQPYPSWILNEAIWVWESSVAMPADGKAYDWDEATISWLEIEPLPPMPTDGKAYDWNQELATWVAIEALEVTPVVNKHCTLNLATGLFIETETLLEV